MIEIILHAGRSALEVALYSLLPIMVVLMIIMRILEAYGILEKLVKWLEPITKPFGLPGLGAVAILQGTLISFIAPLPTMKLMEMRGVSNRNLGATLAGVLAIAPANATFPLATLGLPLGFTIMVSIAGGFIAACSTYYIFGRRLSMEQLQPEKAASNIQQHVSLLALINSGGNEAIRSIIGIIPMLLVSLVIVTGLQSAGVIASLITLLSPVLYHMGIDSLFILPAITKYLAGNTAFVGLIYESAKQADFNLQLLWKGAGFLMHPLDLPGIAILTSGGPRLMGTLWPALGGAAVGIVARGVFTILFG